MTDTTVVNDKVLRMERLIAAPPERVFDLWTEPELLTQWWGPEGCDIPASALDVTPGGHWKTTMRMPSGALHTVSGVYRVIEPPRRLVFTWGWDDDNGVRGHETEVTVTFEAAPGGTKLVLQQQAFESAEQRDRHGSGWSSTLNCLEQLVKKQGE
jgi:uncharacterized protein YndB with AHSA1/START domain